MFGRVGDDVVHQYVDPGVLPVGLQVFLLLKSTLKGILHRRPLHALNIPSHLVHQPGHNQLQIPRMWNTLLGFWLVAFRYTS